MKLELNRSEMERAIKCFISAQGIDIKNQTMKCVFSRETVSVELTVQDNEVSEVEQPIEENITEEIVEETKQKDTPFTSFGE